MKSLGRLVATTILISIIPTSLAFSEESIWDQRSEQVFIEEGKPGVIDSQGKVDLQDSKDDDKRNSVARREPLTGIKSNEVMTTEKLGQIAGGLAIVIAMIIMIGAALKKVGNGAFSSGQTIKVKGMLSLGSKEKIVVIDVENAKLVVGVTANSINTLHVLDEGSKSSCDSDDQHFSDVSTNAAVIDDSNPVFAQQLRKIMSKGNLDG